MSDHDPVPIRDPLHSLAARLGLEHPAESARIFSRWSSIVGPEVADRCRPVSLKSGVLTVRTDSAAWAAELRYLGPEVVRRVNEELGTELVREVKATVSVPVSGGRARQVSASGDDHADRAGDAAEGRFGPRPKPRHPGLSEALEKARLAAKMGREEGGPRGRI